MDSTRFTTITKNNHTFLDLLAQLLNTYVWHCRLGHPIFRHWRLSISTIFLLIYIQIFLFVINVLFLKSQNILLSFLVIVYTIFLFWYILTFEDHLLLLLYKVFNIMCYLWMISLDFFFIYAMKHKSKVLKHFTSFKILVEIQFGTKIKILRMDGGKILQFSIHIIS